MSFSFDNKKEESSSAVTSQTTQQPAGSVGDATAQIVRLQQMAGNRAVDSLLNLEPSARASVPGSEGRPLPAAVRSLFENRFGEDFSQVRVHTGGSAAEAARAFNAVAYTTGNDLVFEAGMFNPESKSGQHLLAHELAHVVQQSRGGAAPPSFDSGSTLEHGAARAAAQFNGGAGPVSVAGASSPGVARQEKPDLPPWKKLLNPLYQKALEVLPQPAAEELEKLNEGARTLLQKGVITDAQLNAVADVVAPFVPPVQQVLDAASIPAAAPPARAPKAPPAIRNLPKITRPVNTLAFEKFGTFGENLVSAHLDEPTIQFGPDPTAGYNFDTYLVNLATGQTIPAQHLGGTRYRVFMGTPECPGCHFGHGLEVDLLGENPILATADAVMTAVGLASAARSGIGLAARLGRARGAGTMTLETAQEWLSGQPAFKPPPETPPPIDISQTSAGPLQLQTAQEWLAENQFMRPQPDAPTIDLGVKPVTPLELQGPQQWLLEPRPVAAPGPAARVPEVIVVGSDAPGGGVPFQEPDPALSAPRSYVDQYGRPILREYVVQRQPAARGPVQSATSRPFNLLEPNIVHGSHLQARQFGGPDAPFNIIPAPKGINLGPMSQIEGDLGAMVDLDQEIYVQQYQQYEGMQRIPTETTYRIFRKFEGSWRLLQEKTVPILH